MNELTTRMKEVGRERDRLLETLELWNAVTIAGIEHDAVKSFSFRTQFLTHTQIKENMRRYCDGQRHDLWTGGEYHNCVLLMNGELLPIPLTKRPQK